MRDLGQVWAAIPDAQAMRLETAIGTVRRVESLAQVVVSGNIAAAAQGVGVDSVGAGALGLVSGDRYSVRLARDRLLIVSTDGLSLTPGWHDAGYAVTDMSALAVFEIDGQLADEIVARATTLPLSGPSPSATVLFAGISTHLYRHTDHASVRVHVDPSQAAYVWEWFNTVLPGADLFSADGRKFPA